MKPPERYPPDDPRESLNRARSNLSKARSRSPGIYLEDLCFDAQQAAEKAVKSVLLARGIEFPYVHDLGLLLTLLEDADEAGPKDVRQAEKLSPFATTSRYPGIAAPVSEPEYAKAVGIAETVVNWAAEHI